MKTRILALTAVVFLLSQAAFCGGSKERTETPNSAAAAEPIEVVFWNGFTASDGDVLRDIYDRFNQQNTKNISVTMDIMPWGNMLEKLAVSISTNTGPTLILLGVESISEYSASGGLLPLDDFWKWSGLDTSKFAQNVIDTFKYEGTTYGIPMQYSTHYLYWNKDLFVEAGLDPERPPETFSEFIDYARKLTNAEKEQYGFGFPAGNIYITNFLWSNGGDWLTENLSQSAINSPEAVEVLTMLQNFATEGVTPLGMTGMDLDNLFYAGKVAMYMNGPWLINGCRTKGMNFGIGSIPAADNGFKQFPGTGVAFMVTSSATDEQKIAAYECIKNWLSKDVLKEWTLKNGFPAWSSEVLADAEVQNDPIQNVLGPLSKYGRLPFPGMPESGRIAADYLDPLFEQLMYGKITPQACAQKMEAGINAVLAGK